MSTLVLDGVRRAARPAVLDLRAPIILPTLLEVVSQTPIEAHERISFRAYLGVSLVAVALGLSAVTMTASVRQFAQTAEARTAPTSPPGASAAALATAPIKSQLQPLLSQFVGTDDSNWGIIVTNLNTGETASINGERAMESASLYKLFVAEAIYKAIDTGRLSYTQDAGGGTGHTIQDCLTAMITVSDNGCGRVLGDLVGWYALNPGLAASGFTGTDMANPAQTTNAHDVALLLQRLYAGTLLSPASNANFLDLLKSQRLNNRLPVGLPAGTTIAHKTGDLDDFVHDVGIVYGPKSDYLVVVMSGPWNDPTTAPAQFGQLSSQLYKYFEN